MLRKESFCRLCLARVQGFPEMAGKGQGVAWGEDGKTHIREVVSPSELARVAMVGGVEEIGGVLLQWLSWQPDLAPKRVVSSPKAL